MFPTTLHITATNSRSTAISPRRITRSPTASSRSPEVPPELGGKGIGSKLIKGALDQARAEGLKVVAQCPFVKAYIEKHNEYADLLK
jgi:predicted GNAT family acetyltransferase